jgi:hypothetical protein
MAPLAVYLRLHGHRPSFFSYCAAVERWEAIRLRLRRRLTDMDSAGRDYVLVGHSLGGLLLADALGELSAHVSPRHLFTLGTPVRPPRLIITALRFRLYRLLTGEAGQRLSDAGSYRFAPLPCQWTAVYGTAGWQQCHWSPFNEPNDGLLAVSEAYTPSASENLFVRSSHTLLMNAASVKARIASALIDH